MIKAMCFNAHSLLLCGLFAYFTACNGFIDTFRSMLEEWLESSCSAVILGDLLLVCRLYDGIGVVGVRVY